MKLAAACIAFLLCGCISMPSKEKPFCVPSAKYDKEKRKGFGGVRCYF